MATITFNIISGQELFTAEIFLIGPPAPPIPTLNNLTLGYHSFTSVPEGNYIITITDANGCVYNIPVTVLLLDCSNTSIFRYATSSIVVNNNMYIGERNLDPQIIRFTDPDDLSLYLTTTVVGVGSASKGLESVCYSSAIDKLYFSARNNATGYLAIIETSPTTLVYTEHVITGISGTMFVIATDNTYIYGGSDTQFFKIRIADWSIIQTETFAGFADSGAIAINTARNQFYISSSGATSNLAIVSTNDVSSYSVTDISTYVSHPSDDLCYYDDGSTCKVYVAGEYNIINWGACYVNVDTLAVAGIDLSPSYGLWAYCTKIYNASSSEVIEVFDISDSSSITTYDIEEAGFEPNEILFVGERMFITKWGDTGVAKLCEYICIDIDCTTTTTTSSTSTTSTTSSTSTSTTTLEPEPTTTTTSTTIEQVAWIFIVLNDPAYVGRTTNDIWFNNDIGLGIWGITNATLEADGLSLFEKEYCNFPSPCTDLTGTDWSLVLFSEVDVPPTYDLVFDRNLGHTAYTWITNTLYTEVDIDIIKTNMLEITDWTIGNRFGMDTWEGAYDWSGVDPSKYTYIIINYGLSIGTTTTTTTCYNLVEYPCGKYIIYNYTEDESSDVVYRDCYTEEWTNTHLMWPHTSLDLTDKCRELKIYSCYLTVEEVEICTTTTTTTSSTSTSTTTIEPTTTTSTSTSSTTTTTSTTICPCDDDELIVTSSTTYDAIANTYGTYCTESGKRYNCQTFELGGDAYIKRVGILGGKPIGSPNITMQALILDTHLYGGRADDCGDSPPCPEVTAADFPFNALRLSSNSITFTEDNPATPQWYYFCFDNYHYTAASSPCVAFVFTVNGVDGNTSENYVQFCTGVNPYADGHYAYKINDLELCAWGEPLVGYDLSCRICYELDA